MSGLYRKEKNCLNCGHEVEAHYCSHCGQPNLELKEPFLGFIAHSIGHYFHFDSKFFHTLVPLLTKPGQVTLDYLAGKRARYIHPVSLYIFVSIVYFLIVPHALEEKHSKKAETESIVKQKEGIREAKSALTDPDQKDKTKREILIEKAFTRQSVQAQKIYLDSLTKVYTAKPTDSLENLLDNLNGIHTDRLDSTLSAYKARQESLPKEKRDSWMERYIQKLMYDDAGKLSTDQGEIKSLATRKAHIKEEVKKYQPKQYFLLMPLLAMFIMFIFRKNHRYYVDHLVFTVHGMTAYFIVSIVTQPLKKYVFGLDSFMSSVVQTAVVIGVIWYLYAGLKLFYNRSRNVTIRKMILLSFLYSIAYAISAWVIEAIVSAMV